MTDEEQNEFAIDEDRPTHWFEPLYAGSGPEGEGVPWANMETHPAFRSWLDRNALDGAGKRALVVGCGMGDDAVELESLGFEVTAFDVSASAIRYCRERFPDSKVTFVEADVLADQPAWRRAFDFVLEIYTVQALPPRYEAEVIRRISDFVAPEGTLLVVAEVVPEERSFDNGPPWKLTPAHVDAFAGTGLSAVDRMEEASNRDEGGTRFVTTFTRPGADPSSRATDDGAGGDRT